MSVLPPGRRFPPGRPLFRAAAPVLRALTRCLVRLRWEELERVPHIDEGGILVVANHISNLDPVLLGDFLAYSGRWPTFLAKSELFSSRWANRFFRSIGQIPVYRGSAQAAGSLIEAKRALAAGETVIIYPEGTITFAPDAWPMVGRTGAARLAIETGCTVVPIASYGAHQLLPPRVGARGLLLRPRKTVTFRVGDPIDMNDLVAMNDRLAAGRIGTSRIMNRLTELVADIRGVPAPDEIYNSQHRSMEPRESC